MHTVTKVEGEVYTHRVIWIAARRLGEAAEQEPRGAFYGHLTSMLMAYFALEAYANFLLDVLDPKLFVHEKTEFGGSLDAKIAWAFARVESQLERGRDPYQTVHRLMDLRHMVVHAKPDRYAERHEGVDPDGIPMFREGELMQRVSSQEWRKALGAVDELCEALHQKVLGVADADQRLRLQSYALKGTTQAQTIRASATEALSTDTGPAEV